MAYEPQTAAQINDLLSAQVVGMAQVEGDDGEMAEYTAPVLTEWVLVANIQDLDGDMLDARLVVMAPPHMLASHVYGLLAMASDRR